MKRLHDLTNAYVKHKYSYTLVLILAVIGILWAVYFRTPIKQPVQNIPTAAQRTSSPHSSQNVSAKNQITPVSGGGTGPTTPSQSTFASNHSPASNSAVEQSVCVTSPRASCVIQFSSGSTIKSLPAKLTDGSGTAIWSWTPAQYGLTSGDWKISATATLNGQSKTANDSIALHVP